MRAATTTVATIWTSPDGGAVILDLLEDYGGKCVSIHFEDIDAAWDWAQKLTGVITFQQHGAPLPSIDVSVPS